jgi:signal transduction histidine kinase
MPPRIDLLIGLLLTAGTQAELWTAEEVEEPFWLQVVSFLAITVPVAWRRRAPLAATAVVAVGFSVQTVAGQAEVLGGFVAAILITYAVAAHEDRRGALVGALLVVVGVVLSALYDPANRSFADTFGNLFLFAVVWTLGRAVRSRQRRVDVAERTAAEREEQARTAVQDERTRIARELHDVVAHSVSVSSTLAWLVGCSATIPTESSSRCGWSRRRAARRSRRCSGCWAFCVRTALGPR